MMLMGGHVEDVAVGLLSALGSAVPNGPHIFPYGSAPELVAYDDVFLNAVMREAIGRAAQPRDLLLLKLICSEIYFSDAEKAVEAVT